MIPSIGLTAFTGKQDIAGKYQALALNSYMYISQDYGAIRVAHTGSPRQIAISKSGQYFAVISSGTRAVYVSSDYGNTFPSKGTAYAFSCIAMSEDGRYITAGRTGGGFRISSNFGETWSSSGSTGNWTSLIMSKSGEYQMAINSSTKRAFLSSNYGSTWAEIKIGGSSIIENVASIAMTPTGERMYVYGADTLARSVNYGTNWSGTGSFTNLTCGLEYGPDFGITIRCDDSGIRRREGYYEYTATSYFEDAINWVETPITGITYIKMKPSEDYFIARTIEGVIIESNNGRSWYKTPYNEMYVSPNWKYRLGTSYGNLYFSSDNGVTFNLMPGISGTVYDFATN